MTPKFKVLTTALWAVVVVGMVGVVASWTTLHLGTTTHAAGPITVLKVEEAPLPEIRVPAFALTDQDGREVSSQSLRGKVWIADFFFSACQGPCPIMNGKMSQLHQRLTDPRIEFISFSIDPETDTPAVLKEYGKKFGADERWRFLTGGNNQTYDIAKALKLPAVPASGDNPIFHTTKFVLVDGRGQVAGYYDFDDPAALEKLAGDAQRLADQAK